MSDPDCRHSQAVIKNNKVAGTITETTKSGEPNFGIQFSGIAEKLEDARYDLACKHYIKRNKSEPKEDEDILNGDSWYKLTPIKIELIDEVNLGFEKKSLEI